MVPAAPELRAAHGALHPVQQLVRVGDLGEVGEVFVGVGRGEDPVEAPTRAQLLLGLDQNLDVVGGQVVGDAASPLLPVANLRVMLCKILSRYNIYLIEVSLLLHVLLSKYFVVKTLQLSLLNGDKCCSQMSTKSFVVYLTKCHIKQSADTVHTQHRAQLLQLHLGLGGNIRGDVVADYSALSIDNRYIDNAMPMGGHIPT